MLNEPDTVRCRSGSKEVSRSVVSTGSGLGRRPENEASHLGVVENPLPPRKHFEPFHPPCPPPVASARRPSRGVDSPRRRRRIYRLRRCPPDFTLMQCSPRRMLWRSKNVENQHSMSAAPSPTRLGRPRTLTRQREVLASDGVPLAVYIDGDPDEMSGPARCSPCTATPTTPRCGTGWSELLAESSPGHPLRRARQRPVRNAGRPIRLPAGPAGRRCPGGAGRDRAGPSGAPARPRLGLGAGLVLPVQSPTDRPDRQLHLDLRAQPGPRPAVAARPAPRPAARLPCCASWRTPPTSRSSCCRRCRSWPGDPACWTGCSARRAPASVACPRSCTAWSSTGPTCSAGAPRPQPIDVPVQVLAPSRDPFVGPQLQLEAPRAVRPAAVRPHRGRWPLAAGDQAGRGGRRGSRVHRADRR